MNDEEADSVVRRIALVAFAIALAWAVSQSDACAWCPLAWDPVEADPPIDGYRVIVCDNPGESICLDDWKRFDVPCSRYDAAPDWQQCKAVWHEDPLHFEGLSSADPIWYHVVSVRGGVESANWSNRVICEGGEIWQESPVP